MKIRPVWLLLCTFGLVLHGYAQPPQPENATTNSGHGYLGARIGDEVVAVDSSNQVACSIRVATVLEDTPAEAAGLEVGDIILAFGTQKVESTDALLEKCRLACPGAPLEITVSRNAQIKQLKVVMGDILADRNRWTLVYHCPYCGCSTF